MRKVILAFIIVALVNSLSYYAIGEQNSEVKIGIIDSVLSEQVLSEYRPEKYIEITDYDTSINNTHGAYSLSIITENSINAEIIYVSVLDENSIGSISDIVKAIDICITEHVDIICMAFSTLEDNDEMHETIKRADNNGIILVASTINYSNIMCYPAMYDEVISISVGFNEEADIILENSCLIVDVISEQFELRGTSVYTSYVTAVIASKYDFSVKTNDSKLTKIKELFLEHKRDNHYRAN